MSFGRDVGLEIVEDGLQLGCFHVLNFEQVCLVRQMLLTLQEGFLLLKNLDLRWFSSKSFLCFRNFRQNLCSQTACVFTLGASLLNLVLHFSQQVNLLL